MPTRKAAPSETTKMLEGWEKNPKGETEGEDNSHLPPLPLPSVNEARPVKDGSVEWDIAEFRAEDKEEPEEEETPEAEEGVSKGGRLT